MNQKTVYIDPTNNYTSAFRPESAKVGDEVILVECTDINTGDSWFKLVPHNGHGIPGIGDHSICRYHDWRGTTSGISIWAHGLRKITKITLSSYDEVLKRKMEGLPIRRKDLHAVTVGKDIQPDWE